MKEFILSGGRGNYTVYDFSHVDLLVGTVSRKDTISVSGSVNNLCSDWTEILGPLLTTRITKMYTHSSNIVTTHTLSKALLYTYKFLRDINFMNQIKSLYGINFTKSTVFCEIHEFTASKICTY